MKILISTILITILFLRVDAQVKNDLDIWNMPDLPIYPGEFEPNWESLSRYEVPSWFREGKLGIWSHWNPQSVPEAGGWYARWMYIQGDKRYEHCLKNYGHPTEFGYKDICSMWTCEDWDPDAFVKMAKEMGGKYFVALANHHDNYDSWNSLYQPWNSLNIGPKKDVIQIWKDATVKQGLPFGVSVHASPARTWGQFMPHFFGSDKTGPKKGIPYDAATVTKADGKGTPWDGLDPKDLYGMPHDKELDANQSPYANQFMWRVDDLLKYNPDLLYFDESVGPNGWVDLGVKMGFGHLAPQIAANYYNKSIAMNKGEKRAVLNMKGVGGWANSLYTMEEAYLVSSGLVKDSEKKIEQQIEPYPFQTDDAIGPWFVNSERLWYHDVNWVIRTLVDIVSKNGNLLLGIPQRAQGAVDEEALKVCCEVGEWLNEYGEGIYGSRPFEVFKGETGNYRFTRKDGKVYLHFLKWPETEEMLIPELKTGGATLGKVLKVEMLGSNKNIRFEQNADGLKLNMPSKSANEVANVFRITHDKTWINDDDPGVGYDGWFHKVNRNRGEFNNDVYESTRKGDRCFYRFDGSQISIITQTGPHLGELVVLIDGALDKVVSLDNGTCDVQQVVYSSRELEKRPHTIEIINNSNKLVMIDAFIVKTEPE